MIVNKVYESSARIPKISAPDIYVIEELVEKYGEDSLYDSLNEAYGEDLNRHYNMTGGGQSRGKLGIIQSLPSFAISALISWPATMLMAIGALSHRMKKRWENKKSWRNRLDPRFWTEWLATPSEKGNIVGRTVSAPFKWLAGILGFRWAKKKGLIDKAKAKLGLGPKDSIQGTPIMLTPEAAKNLDFREWWVTFTNGEVVRVQADSKKNAEIMGAVMLAWLIKKGDVYKALNERIKAGENRYRFVLDDGEVCYWAGTNRDKAFQEALRGRVELCEEFNDMTGEKIKLDPIDPPKTYVSYTEDKGMLIPVPEVNKMKKVSETKPVVKRQEEKTQKLPKPIYKYEGMEQYRATHLGMVFNVPAYSQSEAADIIREFESSQDMQQEIKNIEYGIRDKKPMYRISMGDGDSYKVPASSETDAKDIAEKIYNAKAIAISNRISDAGTYDNYMSEFKDEVSKVKSVKEVRIKPGSTPTIKPDKSIKITHITTGNEKEPAEMFDV